MMPRPSAGTFACCSQLITLAESSRSGASSSVIGWAALLSWRAVGLCLARVGIFEVVMVATVNTTYSQYLSNEQPIIRSSYAVA